MTSNIVGYYRALIEAGEITADPAQMLVVEKLQLLANRLASYTPPARTDFWSFFTRRRGEVPRGLYLFGGVGRGKTMLMDLFFSTVPFEAKRRVHFHAFMAEVHAALHEARQTSAGDPIVQVAGRIAATTGLLCFDEFFVTNIADAMILGRLFEALFDGGVVVVATSNVLPSHLYPNGLNRRLFVPFIELIEDKMEVLQLEAARDYRLNKLQGEPLYFAPLGEAAHAAIDGVWEKLTCGVLAKPATLDVHGRRIEIPKTALGVARFEFPGLCEQPLGASDYLAIADTFHTVIVENVPRMTPNKRDAARRFITFVDTLYDKRAGLVVSAEAEPDGLYPRGEGAGHFERTVSRLMEMRSESYLTGQRLRHS